MYDIVVTIEQLKHLVFIKLIFLSCIPFIRSGSITNSNISLKLEETLAIYYRQ